MNVLKDMEPKLFVLIASLMSEELQELLKVCILVVDDLTATLKRFEQLLNKSPIDIFIPGESYLNTVVHPTTLYERPDITLNSVRRKSMLLPESMAEVSLLKKSQSVFMGQIDPNHESTA